MRTVRINLLLVLGILCLLALGGCSSSSHTVTVTLSPTTPPALNPGGSVDITASVTNDTNSEGVTWSLTGPGTLSANTTTSVTYTAPTSLPNNSSATVTATSLAVSTATASLSITLNAVLTITTTSLPAGTLKVPYYAPVNAGGATGPFTWAIVSGHLPDGLTLGNSTDSSVVISGTPTTLGTDRFTIRVTDGAGNSVDQALSITINKAPPLSVATTFLADGMVGAAYQQQLQATSGTTPYSWSLISGSLPDGLTLTTGGLIQGTPTTTGTSSFTVQVVDSSSPQQKASATLSITINASSSNNSKLSGNYAFLVNGFDGSNHPFTAAGDFVADGAGHIESGIMDSNNTLDLETVQSFTGNYAIGSNDLGTISLVGTGGTRSFAVSLGSDGNSASMIEFDDSTGTGTRDSGVLLKQDVSAFSNSAITGSYAFGLLGVDAGSGRLGMAGQLHANATGLFTAGMLDSDDAGTIASSVNFTGTYSVDTNGRGTATIAIPGVGTTNYSFYVVSPGQLLVMEIDNVVGLSSPLVSGSILQQSGDGSFGNNSLNGSGVFYTTALQTAGPTVQAQVGLITTDGTGDLSLSSNLNTGGTLTTAAGVGNYNVASNGRVALTNSGFQTSDPVLYLVTNNQAFIVGTDAAVTSGFMAAQSVQTFSNASLAGSYAGGSIAPVGSSVSDEVSAAVADGAGNLVLTTDKSGTGGLIQNQVSPDTYFAASNGVVEVDDQNGSLSAYVYLISPTQFALLTFVAGDPDVRVDLFQQ